LYSPPNIIRVIKWRKMRWVEHVACLEEMKNVKFSQKPKGTEGPRHRCQDNFKMVLKEIVYEGVDWIHMAQDRDQWYGLVNSAINLQVQ
jgi:hypothetical protein